MIARETLERAFAEGCEIFAVSGDLDLADLLQKAGLTMSADNNETVIYADDEQVGVVAADFGESDRHIAIRLKRGATPSDYEGKMIRRVRAIGGLSVVMVYHVGKGHEGEYFRYFVRTHNHNQNTKAPE